MEDLNQVLRIRREKLAALQERGIEPFAYNFDVSHGAAAAVAAFEEAETAQTLTEGGEGEQVRVAGRLVAWRSHGKSAFAHLEDASGRIQLYFKKNVLGDQAFDDLDLLDLGDWIGVDGPVFRTRMGEVTVQVGSWTLLSKSLRPLPFGKVETDPETGERKVYSGFADTEARYRQRYADLAVHPEVREVFRTRAHPRRGDPGAPRLPGRRGLPGGGDAGVAAPLRRCLRAAVRHHPQRAGPDHVPPHRR